MPVGDDQSVKAAKALSLPTRSAILGHLLKSEPLTAKEVADEFSLHSNVARAHLDLLVEAGFLATGVRRKGKGRPSKVYFTWEGEMDFPQDWELSPPGQQGPAASELLVGEVEPLAPSGANPFRLIAAILVRLVEHVDPQTLYPLAEQVAREEGAKLVLGYRGGGLDFAAAVRALVEELSRFSPGAHVLRLEHDYAEIETPDCAFRDIALEHSDLVSIIDPALKEGAMAALGHPSEVEAELSVARGDPVCREVIRRKANED
ncbi:MAG: helix-turn-helix transcriptional regulator [Actinomycetota bacterium]|nr:helix-turn-helix domain-containing protein [Actinomycetota bacterium]